MTIRQRHNLLTAMLLVWREHEALLFDLSHTIREQRQALQRLAHVSGWDSTLEEG